MLTCNRFVAGLSEYLDGSLVGAVRARFDRHAAECPRCRIVAETTRRTIELYRAFGPQYVPPALESRVIAAIRNRAPVEH